MTGRQAPARPLHDLTNLATPPTSASVNKPKTAGRSRRPASYRQTSIADAFAARPASPVASTSSSPLSAVRSDGAGSARSGAPSSAFATSPLRPYDGNADRADLMDEDASSDAESSTAPRQKRRKFSATSPTRSEEAVRGLEDVSVEDPWLAAAFDTSAMRRAPSLPATRSLAGEQFSCYELMRRRDLGLRTRPSQVSLKPWLETFVSSNEVDVARIPSQMDHRSWAPPFALAYTNAAKNGGKKIVAVGDEEGMVSLFDGEVNQYHAGPTRRAFPAHDNAIWDVAWSHDDAVLATASGDSTVRLWDSTTQTCIGVLRGHGSSVRNVSWDPFNPSLLATASRDGTARVWDRRISGYAGVLPGEGQAVGMVNQIKNAHVPAKSKTGKGRAPTSVTSVVHLQHQEHLLATSGSSDGRRVNPATYETNEDAVMNTETTRPHGISSLRLAPDGRKLYALSTDASIVALDPLNLTHAAPLITFTPSTVQHGSFYIRCAISPCSRFLASGTSGGEILVWDTEGSGSGQEAVSLRGHELEVGQLDWAADSLVSAGDDLLVRFWRPNLAISRLRTANKASLSEAEVVEAEQVKNRWSGRP
ncbi:hypothetical protein C6P46_003249 [Rhodotorula mucilaginosa]|uniref:WD40 repeat-like protein n=1 Tax=Rhodotorula mucilaginosa TaxID=5537 RepID=A0A9P6W4L8_RHOMI|nr:hypothetical protein C6P46_003249 [Rhodotorula mucilaginosa]